MRRKSFGGPRQVKRRLLKAGLTPKELSVYRFIEGYIVEHDCGPYYSEIGAFLNGKNPNHYRQRGQYYIQILEGKGYIKMGRARRNGIRKTASMRLTDKKPDLDSILKGEPDVGQGIVVQSEPNQNGTGEIDRAG